MDTNSSSCPELSDDEESSGVINQIEVDNIIQPKLDQITSKLDSFNDSNLLELPDNSSDNGIWY